MQKPETHTPEKTDRLTYIGRRIQGGKIQHCFKEPDGQVIWYPKARVSTFGGAVIGSIYEIGNRFPQIWATCAVGKADADQCVAWQAQDRAAYALKTERAASSSPELDAAIKALQVGRASLPRSQRPAFDAWLLNKIR